MKIPYRFPLFESVKTVADLLFYRMILNRVTNNVVPFARNKTHRPHCKLISIKIEANVHQIFHCLDAQLDTSALFEVEIL